MAEQFLAVGSCLARRGVVSNSDTSLWLGNSQGISWAAGGIFLMQTGREKSSVQGQSVLHGASSPTHPTTTDCKSFWNTDVRRLWVLNPSQWRLTFTWVNFYSCLIPNQKLSQSSNRTKSEMFGEMFIWSQRTWKSIRSKSESSQLYNFKSHGIQTTPVL